MRRHLALLFATAVSLIAATVTPTRAGAAYSVLPLREAAACARACADDGLCIVWIQRPQGVCELSATAPATWPTDGSAVGLSSRAPAFIVPPTQTSAEANDRSTGTAANAGPAPAIESSSAEPDETAPDFALLGGPDESALRPRLSRTQ